MSIQEGGRLPTPSSGRCSLSYRSQQLLELRAGLAYQHWRQAPSSAGKVLHREDFILKKPCEETCGYCLLRCPNCSSHAILQERNVDGKIQHVWTIVDDSKSGVNASRRAPYGENPLGWPLGEGPCTVHNKPGGSASNAGHDVNDNSILAKKNDGQIDSGSCKNCEATVHATAPPLSRQGSVNSKLYDLARGKPEQFNESSIAFQIHADPRSNQPSVSSTSQRSKRDNQKLKMESEDPVPTEEQEAQETNSVLFVNATPSEMAEEATANEETETVPEDLAEETEATEESSPEPNLETLSRLSTDMILSELCDKTDQKSLNGESRNPFEEEEEEEEKVNETAIEVEEEVPPDDTNPFKDAEEDAEKVVEEVIEIPETQEPVQTNPFGDPDQDTAEEITEAPPPDVSDTVLTTIDENQTLGDEKPEITSSGEKSSEAGSSYQTESLVTETKSPPTRPSSTLMSFKNLLRSGKIAALRDSEKKNGIAISGGLPTNSFSAYNSNSNFLPYDPSNNPYNVLDDEPPSKMTMFLKELIIGLGVVAIVAVVVMFIGSLGKSMLR